MQTNVVDQIACSRDMSSELSNFVDSLLVSDSSTHGFDCNIDTLQTHSFNDANADPDFHTQGDVATTTTAGLESTVASPACSSVQAPKSKQRASFKTLRGGEDLNRLPKSVRRVITNNTYLRRLYLSPGQVLCLFPGLSTDFIPMTQSRQVRSLLKQKETARDIDLETCDGRHWASILECVVVPSGHLHCRLVNGWSQLCRDNGVAVHDSVVFEMSASSPNEIAARIELKAG